MEPTVLKLLVGVTAVLPMLVGVAGAAFIYSNKAEGSQRMLARTFTLLLWLVSVIALYLYWTYFRHWQITNGGPSLDTGLTTVVPLAMLVACSGVLIVLSVTEKHESKRESSK